MFWWGWWFGIAACFGLVTVTWVFVGVICVCCGVCVLLWFTVGSCGFLGVVFCGLIVRVL